MRIGGLTKCSLINYPGKVSAVIFTQGCNFRCPFCHNPELVYPGQFRTPLAKPGIFEFLKKRGGLLDGVVISGGEPTLQYDLIEFTARIKALGYSVKLDTNGSHPEILESLLEKRLLNFVAMDIKAPFKKYNLLTGVEISLESIKTSIKLIETSGIDYEFRTTFCKQFLDARDFDLIRSQLTDINRYKIQDCVSVS